MEFDLLHLCRETDAVSFERRDRWTNKVAPLRVGVVTLQSRERGRVGIRRYPHPRPNLRFIHNDIRQLGGNKIPQVPSYARDVVGDVGGLWNGSKVLVFWTRKVVGEVERRVLRGLDAP